MSLEVAVRNPERYEGILKTFAKFEGTVLDDKGVLNVYSQLYLDEVVSVDYEGDLSEYKSHFNVGFTEDSSEILMSMTILKFDAAKLADVLTEVNNINANTTSVKLYVDPQNNAVLGELYLLATKDTVKDISLYASGLFIGFTDKIYEALKDFEA